MVDKRMRLLIMKWRFKTLVKIIIAVFVVTTFIVHYTNERFEKTAQILRGIGSRDVKDMVQPFTDTFIINNVYSKGAKVERSSIDEIQKDDINFPVKDEDEDEPYLAVVIMSEPGHEERRNIIRETWMQYNNPKSTVILFFLGRPAQDINALQKESEKYGDLVVDNFEESYYGLTVKTLRILKWFNMNLPKTKFLVKTDDDVFLNVPNLIKYLENNVEKDNFEVTNYMGGVVFKNRSPHIFNTFSKWYVPNKLWNEEINVLKKLGKDREKLTSYPPYLEGNFYVMAGQSVPLLLNASIQLPLFHLEDVYVTGFLGSELLNFNLEQIPNLFTDSSMWPRLYFYYNTIFSASPKDIIAYHCDNDVEIIRLAYQESLKN